MQLSKREAEFLQQLRQRVAERNISRREDVLSCLQELQEENTNRWAQRQELVFQSDNLQRFQAAEEDTQRTDQVAGIFELNQVEHLNGSGQKLSKQQKKEAT